MDTLTSITTEFTSIYSKLLFSFSSISIILYLLDENFLSGKKTTSTVKKLTNTIVIAIITFVSLRYFWGISQDITPKDLSGNVYVVTGCTINGIGYETARILTEWNATVICGMRSDDKGKQTTELIKKSLASTNSKGQFSYEILDLLSFSSVQHFANKISYRYPKIDGIILNAGALIDKYTMSPQDNLEAQFQANHASHHLLLRLLENNLRAGGNSSSPVARVVFVSSTCYATIFKLHRDWWTNQVNNKDWVGGNYPAMDIYCETKLMNVLEMKHFERHFREQETPNQRRIVANAVCPGYVSTQFQSHMTELPFPFSFPSLPIVLNNVARTPAQGAIRTLQALTLPEYEQAGGKFLDSYFPLPTPPWTVTEDNAKWLNDLTENLVKKYL
jgi:NAD(P)-dependent dehydrogenase (short-subunit alcohol dehydrogenase family)